MSKPLQFSIEWPALADEGVRLFNSGEYHACHDAFEDIWLDSAGDQKTFYQGLIQTAVAYYKIVGRGFPGAKALFERGMEKLRKTRHLATPLKVDEFLAAAEQHYGRLVELGEERMHEIAEATFPKMIYVDGYTPQPPPDPSWRRKHNEKHHA